MTLNKNEGIIKLIFSWLAIFNNTNNKSIYFITGLYFEENHIPIRLIDFQGLQYSVWSKEEMVHLLRGIFKSYENVIKELNIIGLPEFWKEAWEISQATYPSNGVDFLEDNYIIDANSVLMMSQDLLEALLQSIAIIRRSEDLSRFVWHCHYILYHSSKDAFTYFKSWPLLKNSMGEFAEIFPAVVCISGLPEITQFYTDKGIPEDIFIDTLSDVRVTMEHFRSINGKWGLELLSWLYKHFTGKVFKLGRLQFKYNQFNRGLQVYRNIKTREIIALSNSRITYQKNGLIEGINGIFPCEEAWVSELTVDGEYLVGNPITVWGTCEKDKICISLNEWKPVLGKDDGILEVHIARGGQLSPSACQDSYRKAVDFYSAYFPEYRFVAYTCESWLLDPQLRQLLPPSSNIIEFQKDYYLYPIPSDGNDVYEYVLNIKPADFVKAPKDTFLRRTVINYIAAGNRIKSSGGFILLEDLPFI